MMVGVILILLDCCVADTPAHDLIASSSLVLASSCPLVARNLSANLRQVRVSHVVPSSAILKNVEVHLYALIGLLLGSEAPVTTPFDFLFYSHVRCC